MLPSRPPGIVVANCQVANFDEFLTVLTIDATALMLLPFEEGLEQGLADDTLVLKEKRAINDSIRQQTSTLTENRHREVQQKNKFALKLLSHASLS